MIVLVTVVYCLLWLQMIPLIKRSTDDLVAVIGEKAGSEETFEAVEYV